MADPQGVRLSGRRLTLAFGAALVTALAMLALPIHVVPGNGSLRCADSLFAGGFHYDDSEGLGRECTDAAWDRLRAGVVVGVGAGAFAVGLGFNRRRRAVVCLASTFIGCLGLLEIFGNLMG
jgi:hypothetical protein